MRRVLNNADTPRSQRPEQEQHINLELDKDNEAQDTVEKPMAVEEILSEKKLGPWPYIEEYFKFKSKKGLRLSFETIVHSGHKSSFMHYEIPHWSKTSYSECSLVSILII